VLIKGWQDSTNHDGDEGVLVLLVRHLGRHVDTREPAPVPRMRVVPADRVLETPNLTRKRVAISTRPTNKIHGQRTRSQLAMYWTMYSFASLAALTRVSVPWTGRANESMMTRDVPTTLPCMRPMISYGTPDRAWITYGMRRLSDGSEAPKRDRSPF
jgi:hypothetical protein